MYKIFFNHREIVIAQPAYQNLFQHFYVIENIQTADDIKNWFSKFMNESQPNALLLHDHPDKFMTATFGRAFTIIEAAGGIVKRDNRLLFIFRNGKWDLPKGKIDAGETPEEAAIREVEEECGIHGHRIVKSIPPTWHIYQSTWNDSAGTWMLKKTHWFEMEYAGIENGTPETAENISEIRWFGRDELGEVLGNTYRNLRDLIEVYNE
jgi:8-oxo-dGTP pyrophosphatase MutT (NUDIX family)